MVVKIITSDVLDMYFFNEENNHKMAGNDGGVKLNLRI